MPTKKLLCEKIDKLFGSEGLHSGDFRKVWFAAEAADAAAEVVETEKAKAEEEAEKAAAEAKAAKTKAAVDFINPDNSKRLDLGSLKIENVNNITDKTGKITSTEFTVKDIKFTLTEAQLQNAQLCTNLNFFLNVIEKGEMKDFVFTDESILNLDSTDRNKDSASLIIDMKKTLQNAPLPDTLKLVFNLGGDKKITANVLDAGEGRPSTEEQNNINDILRDKDLTNIDKSTLESIAKLFAEPLDKQGEDQQNEIDSLDDILSRMGDDTTKEELNGQEIQFSYGENEKGTFIINTSGKWIWTKEKATLQTENGKTVEITKKNNSFEIKLTTNVDGADKEVVMMYKKDGNKFVPDGYKMDDVEFDANGRPKRDQQGEEMMEQTTAMFGQFNDYMIQFAEILDKVLQFFGPDAEESNGKVIYLMTRKGLGYDNSDALDGVSFKDFINALYTKNGENYEKNSQTEINSALKGLNVPFNLGGGRAKGLYELIDKLNPNQSGILEAYNDDALSKLPLSEVLGQKFLTVRGDYKLAAISNGEPKPETEKKDEAVEETGTAATATATAEAEAAPAAEEAAATATPAATD